MKAKSLLISRKQITDLTPINDNLNFDYLLPHVLSAQDLMLAPVLGQALLDYLMQQVKDKTTTTDEKILLEDYIAPFLAYSVLVKAIPSLSIKMVDSGIVQRIADDSTPLSIEEQQVLQSQFERDRDDYKQRLIEYLCANHTLFPAFQQSKYWEIGPSAYNYDMGLGLTGVSGRTEGSSGSSSGGGQTNNKFTDLKDTPDDYDGAADQFVKVRSTEDGLEFVASTPGGVSSVTGPNVDNSDPSNPVVNARVEGVTGPSVDNTDPNNPIVDAQVVSVVAGTNVSVNNADPKNPVVNAASFTDAGVVDRSYLTGDEETTTQGTFYLASVEGKGTVPEVQQVVVNNDNQTQFFGQDVLGTVVTPIAGMIRRGNYSGFLSCEVNSNSGEQRFQVEAYIADDQGVPIDSGVTGQPVGDLGVRPVAVLDSGIVDMSADNETQINVSAFLAEDVDYPANTRVRYHVSATKVGTQGGNVTISLYYGFDHNSFIEVPASADTDDIIDNSKYGKLNATEALNETIQWFPQWNPGLYPRHSMTVDGDWTMISNKETADRPAPQPSGNPIDAIPEDIAWTVQTDSGYVATGNQYTFTESGWIKGFDFYIQNTGANIFNQVFVIDVTGGGNTILKELIIPPTFTGPAWYRLDFNQVVESGAVLQVGVISQNNADETQNFSHVWQYGGASNNQDPVTGTWNHNNDNSILRIHELDEGAVNRGADLAAIAVGDTVTMTSGGTEWIYRINAAGVLVGSVYQFLDIDLIGTVGTFSLLESVTIVGKTVGTALTDYVINSGYWPGNQPSFATTVGFIETSSGGGIVTDNDAYGGSIEFQPASVSEDWDYVAYYGSSTGGVTAQLVQLQGAYSDETSDLVAGPGSVWGKRLAQGFTLSDWIFDVRIAPTGSAITLDVKKNGVSIFSTKPTISAGTFVSSGAVLSTTDFNVGDDLTVHIDAIGSTIAGAGLKGDIIGTLK